MILKITTVLFLVHGLGMPKWEWRCGFYSGSRPGECSSGTAATFQEARGAFEIACGHLGVNL
jgi:hypothetical protein